MSKPSVTLFWFRRDLRLEDNAGLSQALKSQDPVLPLFIFDTDILNDLKDSIDGRVQFIHQCIQSLRDELAQKNSPILVRQGQPVNVFKTLLETYHVHAVYCNEDYEPYARSRDAQVKSLLAENGISFHAFKDQVIFAPTEVRKSDGNPYTVYTAYKNKWKSVLKSSHLQSVYPDQEWGNLLQSTPLPIPDIETTGFKTGNFYFPPAEINESIIRSYHETRDYPHLAHGTSRLGLHLRFGTISIRVLVRKALEWNETFLNELIWREFFMMILAHFPRVVTQSFKNAYDRIQWLNDPAEFERWCQGQTGFPMIDAGMRQLNQTGYMHNRVRMIVANFLTKLLLIDWRWGEAYFAEKLLDFELAANNGNWQWSAGTGCDAQPYFRIFNPQTQIEKFDPERKYIRQWLPEFGTPDYPRPMVDYGFARERALTIYKQALTGPRATD